MVFVLLSWTLCNQIKLELMERNDPNTMIIYYPYRRGEKNLMEMMDIL